jgi:enterochelin esterase-like enzyme
MIPRRVSLAPLLVLGISVACGTPASPPSQRDAAADPVPAHDAFTIESRAVGEPRPVNVWVPDAQRAAVAARTLALPALYMPDGGTNEDFPHVVRTVATLLARGAIRPVIVVGIPNTQRRRDLSGETSVPSDREMAPVVGGSAAFRRFVREELIPEIERRYATTP